MTDHKELAAKLAEMTGGFDLRRDAIEAALDVAYGRGVEDAARVAKNRAATWRDTYNDGVCSLPLEEECEDIGRAILALSPGDGR